MHKKRTQAVACTISYSGIGVFRNLLLRELNSNKVLILRHASNCYGASVTSTLRSIGNARGIPLSTLKQAANSLKDLGLIEYGSATEPKGLSVTKAGIEALELMACEFGDIDG